MKNKNSGVALIITLILLAVVTVMAVAFLASSRRERGAVTTTTDTAGARLAADAALAQAEVQVMANVLATTNPYNFGLVVSTNYLPPTTGNVLDDLTNMLISPRAPVWLSNTVTHVMENRFYLDLNRNGVDDPNGLLPLISPDPNNPYYDTNGNTMPNIINGDTESNLDVGDPEWIGVLDHPDQPHGPNNRFIARYAFVAVPIGNALDLNAIHNYAAGVLQNQSLTLGQDHFLRNQGVGSWEINLAAFLTDLNTNQWDSPTAPNPSYFYNEWMGSPNTGYGFEDALSLLSYRYGGNFNTLRSPNLLFPSTNTFLTNIDGYANGPLQIPPANISENAQNVFLPWCGADNTNHFFDMQELFNPNESSVNFTNRLLAANTDTNSTYGRYTFYRLLAQMGVESAPEQDKMNLNYVNVDNNGNVVPGMETNFFQWTPVQFFTNAADRMLRAYSQDWLARDPLDFVASYDVTNAFGITDIPVLVSNKPVYSPAIQHVLQLAANMYDATANNSIGGSRDWPDVFRPTFNVVLENGYTNVYVNGYEPIVFNSPPNINTAPLDLPVDVTSPLLALNAGVNTPNGNVYGVPWIIGAKKYFPNFNEFSMECPVQLTRRLQFIRTTNSAGIPTFTATNQMYDMSISNELGVECWNSYSNNYVPYSGNVTVVVRDNLSMTLALTNNALNISSNYPVSISTNLSMWPGWVNNIANTNAFVVAMDTNINFLPESVYRFATESFIPTYLNPSWETGIYPITILPDFTLQTANRVQAFILDGTNVIDYVQFGGPNSQRDLNAEIFTDNNYTNAGVWDATLSSPGLPNGILHQIGISKASTAYPNGPPKIDGLWHGDPQSIFFNTAPTYQQDSFASFFLPARSLVTVTGWGGYPTVSSSTNNTGLTNEAPYAPTRYAVEYVTWQANDPLVHYITNDLNFAAEIPNKEPYPGITNYNYSALPLSTLTHLNLGQLNDHYSPWGGNTNFPPNSNTPDDPNVIDAYNITVKDPLIYYSDDWDFPSYQLPTVGWLGRVHRGTPWQTVDMKSALPSITIWTNWTGDLNAFDADNSSPGEDRQLFDLFSTAFNDNATRGQLSVNVGAPNGPSLAAWSALFSGIVVPTNTIGDYTNIQPAGVAGASSPLEALVVNINQTRSTFINADGLAGTFEHVGDILATPQLSIFANVIGQQSPFLNTNTIYNDEIYEWLPQQVMSLLRDSGTPQSPMRYVVYCYGQTLKPAPNGIVTSGTQFGLCTNYQVVAEADTRAVVQFNSERISNIFQTNNPVTGNLIWTNVPSVTNNNAVIESFNVLPSN